MAKEQIFQHAALHTRRLLERAQRRFARTMPAVEIRFDLKGQSAGQVCFEPGGRPLIRYNALLLQENRMPFLARTVPHEAAHVVARTLAGPVIRPHGPEWQAVMAFFGADASRCHRYDTRRCTTRRLQRFAYRCSCRVHHLTSIRHNRIAGGQVYYCRDCRRRLKPAEPPDDA